MFSTLYRAYKLIKNGHFPIFLDEINKRIYSESVSLGLQRDLNEDFEVLPAKIKIEVRLIKKGDAAVLLEETRKSSVNPRIIASQQRLIDSGIPTGFVAVTEDDTPCYMQWLIGYRDNAAMINFFNGDFPALKKSEALLEGAFSNPDYRGLRIMPEAMSMIAEKAIDVNARWVNTFVDITNIASLKGCERAGFKPYLMKKDRWILFHRTVSFHPLPDDLKEKFYELTDSKAGMTRVPAPAAATKSSNLNVLH